MYHGSNTMYLKWCSDKGKLSGGKRTDGKVLKPGTAVFVWNGKNYSHVGLYIGDGTVIEAMGTRNGVTTTKVSASKWTNWGELKGVEYGSESAGTELSVGTELSAGPSSRRATIRRGDKNDAVRECQGILARLGYDLGRCGIDGDFGKCTEAAVRKYQKERGLTVDGIVGPKTWAALMKEV